MIENTFPATTIYVPTNFDSDQKGEGERGKTEVQFLQYYHKYSKQNLDLTFTLVREMKNIIVLCVA